jgi:hypothetical protein
MLLLDLHLEWVNVMGRKVVQEPTYTEMLSIVIADGDDETAADLQGAMDDEAEDKDWLEP